MISTKNEMGKFDQEREENKANGKLPLNLIIRTWVPSKWRFVDLETGDIWKDENGRFTKVKHGTYREDDSMLDRDGLRGRGTF